jgi:HEPN domain-containing protein
MADLEHARSLLRLAQRDLNAVIAMQESALVADEILGFHAQQAVEKALKAWLSVKGLVYPLTHQLPRLLALLEGAGADVEPFWPLVRFTPFAVQARYEEGPPEADEVLDRPAVVTEVSALLEFVAAVLSSAATGAGNAPARP